MRKNVCIITLLFILSSFSMKLVAQKDLDDLVEKCEAMTSVDMNVVRTRNPKTTELEREVINIRIKDNLALVDKFLSVLDKLDTTSAIHVAKNRQGGRIINLLYRFKDGSYAFSYNESEKSADISIIRQRQMTTSFKESAKITQKESASK